MMAMIPVMNTAITYGGIPINHKFSGSGLMPGNWKSRTCQPYPTVNATVRNSAVVGPIPLTKPDLVLGSDFSAVKKNPKL